MSLIDIPGYEGLYKISTLDSNIYSFSKWSNGNILQVFTNRQGDKRVNLSKNGQVKQHKLSELQKLITKKGEKHGNT